MNYIHTALNIIQKLYNDGYHEAVYETRHKLYIKLLNEIANGNCDNPKESAKQALHLEDKKSHYIDSFLNPISET